MTGFINDCMTEELKHVARCGVDPDYCMAYAGEYGGLGIPGVPFKELTLAAIRSSWKSVRRCLRRGVSDSRCMRTGGTVLSIWRCRNL